MQDAEKAAFARGVSAEALMNQAGAGIAQAVQQFFPCPGYCLVFSGKGNNGGDALVAAARLKRTGWHTDVHLSFPEPQCSELLRKKSPSSGILPRLRQACRLQIQALHH